MSREASALRDVPAVEPQLQLLSSNNSNRDRPRGVTNGASTTQSGADARRGDALRAGYDTELLARRVRP